jgi:hypothetical protein
VQRKDDDKQKIEHGRHPMRFEGMKR